MHEQHEELTITLPVANQLKIAMKWLIIPTLLEVHYPSNKQGPDSSAISFYAENSRIQEPPLDLQSFSCAA